MRQTSARATFAVLALTALLIVVPGGQPQIISTAAAARPVAAPISIAYPQRADAALQSFLQKYWNPSRHYLNETYPSNGHLTGYWTYANGWRAIIANARRTRRQADLDRIAAFYQGQNARGWSARFYDDECWMTLALLDAYSVTPRSRYLKQAEALMADIENGWDDSCCGSAPGGIWWNKAHTQKATASNAGPVIAACELYRATGKPAYLKFARQVYHYWWSAMVDPVTYQVTDHINPDGAKLWWKFSYNEGLMIGAGDALYHATGDRVYLTNALKVARFMIQNEVASTPRGPVLFDGPSERCRGDCAEFKGPAYHYLCALYRDCPRPEYYAVLKGSADALWDLARNPAQQLFAVDWAGPPPSRATQAQENAAVLALGDFASLQDSDPGSEGSGHLLLCVHGRTSAPMRMLTSWTSAAGIALVLARSAAGAPGARLGLSVASHGVLMKDGRPYRGIGVNYFNAFSRHLLDPSDTSYEAGFAALTRARIPFVRLMGCGFWPVEQKLYREHREEFLRRFDDVVRAAERHGIGLIPSLFWNVATVPDLVGEPVSAWGQRAQRAPGAEPDAGLHARLCEGSGDTLPEVPGHLGLGVRQRVQPGRRPAQRRGAPAARDSQPGHAGPPQ